MLNFTRLIWKTLYCCHCYQLYFTFSGSMGCFGGNTQVLRKHLQIVQTEQGGKDCIYSMARQHSGTNCLNCTVSSQWISKQKNAVSRINSSQTMLEGVFYDLQYISGRQQWGLFGVAVFYSRANQKYRVWVQCPGMLLGRIYIIFCRLQK